MLALNNAKYLENGKEMNVRGEDLMGTAKPYHTGFLGFNFVAYGNLDSTGYLDRDSWHPSLHWRILVDIGFLRDEEQDFLKETIAWKEATKTILGASSSSENDLVSAVSSKTTFRNIDERNQLVAGLKWPGIFSESKITQKGNPLDALCATLEEKMAYQEGERDLVLSNKVLDGRISDKGILVPMNPSINKPLMQELEEKHGLVFPASLLRHTY
ncbi:Saccharopine dehydrogenase [NADP(+), L-glutamate-forming] [Tolypocladium paradoxum]|uniref:Saccharopine dehydrogenase [NADP(+), L-glutamate-forming] n=1 Tax=Tolypocladium paradoxum TaxID=94208 RepID=A0A2S4L7G6_9HYPO|nr:Saccharopine dehydrogenase [NADP(+), L-glutamate-forming] [Tolypocladium paradoxum]